MYLDHNHSQLLLLTPSRLSLTSLTSPNSMFSVFFFLNSFCCCFIIVHDYNLCCPYSPSCCAVHWNMVSQPGAYLKKENQLSPRSHQLPIVLIKNSFPLHATVLIRLSSCRSCVAHWSCCVHEQPCHIEKTVLLSSSLDCGS